MFGNSHANSHANANSPYTDLQTIQITLDPIYDIERAVIEHGLSSDIIKRMFLIGYTLCASHVDIMEDLVRECMKEHAHSELVRRFQAEIQDLKEENLQIVTTNEKALDAIHSRYSLELENRNLRVEHLQKMLAESEKKSQELFQDTFKESVQQLRDMLKEKDIQMQLLRSTNASKGIIGESKIMDALKAVYETAEITYTGKTPHSCDIKMCCGENMFMFESKYKGHIVKEDVVKFQHDITNAGVGVYGGIFVSIMSKNIPGKGCFCMERVEGVPVIYLGYENESEFDLLFRHHVSMFVQMAGMLRMTMSEDIKTHEDDDMTELLHQVTSDITFYSDMLKKNKKRMDEFKGRCLKLHQEVENDQCDIIKRLDDALLKLSSKIPLKVPSKIPIKVDGGLPQPKTNMQSTQDTSSYRCNTCSKEFTTQRGLNIHISSSHPPSKISSL
jgi:hypothetical protein